MKIIETGPREIGFVLLGHCQNLLDDPRILNLSVMLGNYLQQTTSADIFRCIFFLAL